MRAAQGIDLDKDSSLHCPTSLFALLSIPVFASPSLDAAQDLFRVFSKMQCGHDNVVGKGGEEDADDDDDEDDDDDDSCV